jgi:DNA helicase II / ATP-dependent DNA helicase PcrA
MEGTISKLARAQDELARAQERVLGTLQPSGGGLGFTIGGRVFHQKFGYGRITGVDGQKLAIHFDAAGDKKIMANYVRACVETE